MPATRSPAQIEASRRNGARSKGPVTEEGKARASRNALKHGLTAMEHLVLEDEVPDDLEELIETVAEEVAATTEIEHRLAIAFWKSERADKIETALFDAAPRIRPPHGGYKWEEADPLTTFDVRRFNAIRGYHAQQGREISRCLKELRLLRKEALTRTDEPDKPTEKEPKAPSVPANDDAGAPAALAEPASRNEPEHAADPAPTEAWTVDGVTLLDAWGRPRRLPRGEEAARPDSHPARPALRAMAGPDGGSVADDRGPAGCRAR